MAEIEDIAVSSIPHYEVIYPLIRQEGPLYVCGSSRLADG